MGFRLARSSARGQVTTTPDLSGSFDTDEARMTCRAKGAWTTDDLTLIPAHCQSQLWRARKWRAPSGRLLLSGTEAMHGCMYCAYEAH